MHLGTMWEPCGYDMGACGSGIYHCTYLHIARGPPKWPDVSQPLVRIDFTPRCCGLGRQVRFLA